MKLTINIDTLKKANQIVCENILQSIFDDPNSRGQQLDIAEECIEEFEKNGIKLPALNAKQIDEVKSYVSSDDDYASNAAAIIFSYFHEQDLINYEEY